MSKLAQLLFAIATPVLLAAPKKKVAAKKKVVKKPTKKTVARKPKTSAAHGLTTDMAPIKGK